MVTSRSPVGALLGCLRVDLDSGPVSGSRLLLLDGHSIAYRAFYALREVEMATTTGQPTNGVFGFTSMLINLLRDEDPTHVAVAFDVSRQKTSRRPVPHEATAGLEASCPPFVSLVPQVVSR